MPSAWGCPSSAQSLAASPPSCDVHHRDLQRPLNVCAVKGGAFQWVITSRRRLCKATGLERSAASAASRSASAANSAIAREQRQSVGDGVFLALRRSVGHALRRPRSPLRARTASKRRRGRAGRRERHRARDARARRRSRVRARPPVGRQDPAAGLFRADQLAPHRAARARPLCRTADYAAWRRLGRNHGVRHN